MSYREEIELCLQANEGMISADHCRMKQIPTMYLTRIVQQGYLKRLAKGLYSLSNVVKDEFFVFQHQFKKTVFSYETALFLLGQSDHIPVVMDVTVERSYKFNLLPYHVRTHYVHKDIFDLGLTQVKTMYGNWVRIYNYERILCDFISHKNKVDSESYVKAIQGYAKYPAKDLHLLWDIASKIGIATQMQEILEIVYV